MLVLGQEILLRFALERKDLLFGQFEVLNVCCHELQCFEPGCAPLETVVSLLGQQSIVFKIFKPANEVMPEEVVAGLQDVLAGNAAAAHLQSSSASANDRAQPVDP